MLADVLDRCAAGDLREKGLAVDETPIGVGVEEVGRKVGIKPGDISLLDGSDEVPVELLKLGAVLFAVGHGSTPLGWGERAFRTLRRLNESNRGKPRFRFVGPPKAIQLGELTILFIQHAHLRAAAPTGARVSLGSIASWASCPLSRQSGHGRA